MLINVELATQATHFRYVQPTVSLYYLSNQQPRVRISDYIVLV